MKSYFLGILFVLFSFALVAEETTAKVKEHSAASHSELDSNNTEAGSSEAGEKNKPANDAINNFSVNQSEKGGIITANQAKTITGKQPEFTGLDSSYLLNSFGALVIVIGLILGAAWLIRRTKAFDFSGNKQVKLVEVLALGTKEKIAVIQCNGEFLLVGVTAHNINLLSKLDDYQVTSEGQQATSFNHLFNKFKQDAK